MTFDERVYRLVRTIPEGSVASYGQIATLLGSPRAARAVGFSLHRLPPGSGVPWWRVINSKGQISIQNMAHPAEEQLALLEKENVFFDQSDGVSILKNSDAWWRDEC